ncbi:MAG: MerR family transcriptional regulator [Aquabacterium sp.]
MNTESGAPLLEVTLEELWLDMEEVCHVACVEVAWVQARLDCGALTAQRTEAGDAWRFNDLALCHIRRMACLERDFDAVPELAALVIDLEEEVRRLRERLKWLEGGSEGGSDGGIA